MTTTALGSRASLTRYKAFIWLLCCLPVIQAILSLRITDSRAPWTIAIFALRPLGILGALYLFLDSAYRAPDRRRLAWLCFALQMLLTFIYDVQRVFQDSSPSTPLLKVLVVLIYLCALMGSALYLRPHSWKVGSMLRVVIGSITVGYAVFVFFQSVSVKIALWRSEADAILPFIAFDIGILFAVTVVGLRYGWRNHPIIPPLLLSLSCLLLADIFYLLMGLTEGLERPWVVTPLYSFQTILLAVAAHRDVTSTSLSPASSAPAEVVPFGEWMLWTFIPISAVLGTFLMANLNGRPHDGSLILLTILAVIHELVAALDYRRVLHNLHSSNQQLSAANEQIHTEVATTEAFLMRLAHDLGSPVHGLLSIVSIDAAWRDDQRRLQQMAIKQVNLLRTFADQARTYLQARTVELCKSDVLLVPIFLDAVDAIELLSQQHDVWIVQDIDVEPHLTVWGEEVAIRRILDNLLINAVRISPKGEEVMIRLTVPVPGQVEIAVQDKGPGIPPERQANLFKPYAALQRLDGQEHPSPTGTGLGLGLAIVKELTTALGGMCGVKSAPGAGSTFYVRLPLKLMVE